MSLAAALSFRSPRGVNRSFFLAAAWWPRLFLISWSQLQKSTILVHCSLIRGVLDARTTVVLRHGNEVLGGVEEVIPALLGGVLDAMDVAPPLLESPIVDSPLVEKPPLVGPPLIVPLLVKGLPVELLLNREDEARPDVPIAEEVPIPEEPGRLLGGELAPMLLDKSPLEEPADAEPRLLEGLLVRPLLWPLLGSDEMLPPEEIWLEARPLDEARLPDVVPIELMSEEDPPAEEESGSEVFRLEADDGYDVHADEVIPELRLLDVSRDDVRADDVSEEFGLDGDCEEEGGGSLVEPGGGSTDGSVGGSVTSPPALGRSSGSSHRSSWGGSGQRLRGSSGPSSMRTLNEWSNKTRRVSTRAVTRGEPEESSTRTCPSQGTGGAVRGAVSRK